MRKAGILIALTCLFGACQSDRLYEQYHGMESSEWRVLDTVSFQPEIAEENFAVVLGIRYNNDYGYRNLFLRFTLQDSLDRTIDSKLMDVPLFESTSGRPIGSGFGHTFTKYDTLPIDTHFHTISLLQYMRIDTLAGIEAVGLKVVRR